jgi:hypothetical protein
MGIQTYIFLGVLLIVTCWIAVAILRAHRRISSLFDNLDLAAVRGYLDALVESREPGAYLIFEEMGRTKRFVQFRREVGPTGSSLSCYFPRAPWSLAYIEALQALLTSKDIPISEVTGGQGETVSGFIVAERLHPQDAAHLTDDIFRQVFGLELLRLRVWGHGVKDAMVSDSRADSGI